MHIEALNVMMQRLGEQLQGGLAESMAAAKGGNEEARLRQNRWGAWVTARV